MKMIINKPVLFAVTILTATILSICPCIVTAQDAAELMKQSHLAYYYPANDGSADVVMKIVKKGKERIKQFIMLRLDVEEGGVQKYYTYFKKPSDISRLVFMVHKNPDGNDARWIYIPSVDLIKPISADDKNSSFVGSHFSYEDVSGRHWNEDNHRLLDGNHGLLEDSALGDKEVYLIESIPKEAYKGFARKITYIDKDTMLPLREEYYDKKDELVRLFHADKIEVIDGVATITVRVMENVKKNQKTIIEFTNVAYNVGLDEEIFTERYLKNPPRKFIK